MKKSILLVVVLFAFLVSCSKDESLKQYSLSIQITPTESGNVSPSSNTYNENETVSLLATPLAGFVFKNWEGDVTGTTNPITITMNMSKSITCVFEELDTDGDGVTDNNDTCPDTPSGETVNSNGCSDSQKDTDGDGVFDSVDSCSDTPNGESVDSNGCSDSQKDTDSDGVMDSVDTCPNTTIGITIDSNGCALSPIYLGSNGITIKCFEWGEIGQTGEVNGIIYTVVSETILRQMVDNGEDVTKVCTSKVTDMSYMFFINFVLTSQFNQDISSWDVSNVTNMNAMFFYSQFNQDISSWNVSNVTNMSGMFNDSQFNQDISSWNVSNVTDMSSMFNDSQFNQDISSWDVSKVTKMSGMFRDSKFNQDISSWNVSNVTNMSYMFIDSSQFNQNLSIWNVTNVTSCRAFSEGTVSWTLPKPNFTNCNPNF